jgi:glycosyltransferase involved in cell wall biosynthesis
VAVVHGSWPHAVFAPEVRRSGVRLVHFVHGEVIGRHWLERWAARTLPDLVIANSHFTARTAVKLFPDHPPAVVYHPVPAPDLPDREVARRRVRAELATPEEAIVVLMVSRIESLKGHAVLLDATRQIADIAGWVCWIVGGAQRPYEVELLAVLQRQAKSLGVADRIRFAGPRADVLAVMAAADIYCQPNTGPEGFGLTFLESLYSGLPVVTSGFGGTTEIVDGTCGVLTAPGDTAAVAAALRELIRDPTRRRALGAAGPNRAALLCDPARQLGAAVMLLRAAKSGA